MTSIDLPTQLVAEQGLIGRRGAVVAIDPNNGDVIALVSTPGFDPNPFGRGLTTAEYARAARQHRQAAAQSRDPRRISARLDREAGDRARRPHTRRHDAAAHRSLRRLFLSAGLEPSLPRLARGRTRRRSRWKPPSRSPATCTSTSSPRCWASRNSRAGSRISASAQPTGIDISGERKGILPTPEWKKARFKNPADQVWFPGETVSFGIGQGYLIVTPLQAAHMASILATRGKSYQPRLVTAYREQGTGKVEKIAPKLLETVDGVARELEDRRSTAWSR